MSMSNDSQEPGSKEVAVSTVCYVLALIFAICGIGATILGVTEAFFPGIIPAIALGCLGVYSQRRGN